MEITGTTALVTGAAGGIGSAVTRLVRFSDSLRATYVDEPVGFSVVCPGFTTGGGMYSRMEDLGVRSNSMLGTTTVEKVAEAVVQVVEHDEPRRLVNNRPLKPAVALAALAPGLGQRFVERAGGNALFRKLASSRETQPR